jgi:hypothetical protein
VTGFDPENQEQIARRLREEGTAEAPPDLADEVMRRVRSEPRRSTSSVRRPLVTLLAAGLIIVALIGGISKLGGGSGSASMGGSTPEHAATGAKPAAGSKSAIVGSRVIENVPRSALRHLAAGPLLAPFTTDSVFAPCGRAADLGRPDRYTLSVPYEAWAPVQSQLEKARKDSGASLVTVRLHRLAPGIARASVTCP